METDIFEESRFGKCLFGDGIGLVNTDPPAEEVQQVKRVAAESRLGQTSNTLPVEETIYPDRLVPRLVLHDAVRALRGFGMRLGRPGRSWTSSLQQTLELVGITALDEETVRVVSSR